MDDFATLLQGLFAPAGANTFFFQRTAGTVLATVDGGFDLKAVLGFLFLHTVKSNCFPVGTGVCVGLGFIGHILAATDVRAVFLRLLLVRVFITYLIKHQ